MTTNQPVRVLILTSDAGAGHRSAANAVAQALSARHGNSCVTKIINPVQEPDGPATFQRGEANYLDFAHRKPRLYRLQHEWLDSRLAVAALQRGAGFQLRRVMSRLMDEYKPDVILSTYLLFGCGVAAANAQRMKRIPHATVVTDMGFTAHGVWFCKNDACCFVPSNEVRAKALHDGLRPNQIAVTGIAVDLRFGADAESQKKQREQLGWQENITTILIMNGGAGMGRVEKFAQAIDAAELPVQLAIVAGKNASLEQTLRGQNWRVPTHVYGFTRDVPNLMRAADVVLTKAGGLSVAEALAAGKPIILHDAIEGQETGNVEHVTQNGAGEWAPTPETVVKTLQRWLANDQALLKQRANQAARSGKPNAANEIADRLFLLATRKTLPRHRS